MNDISQSALNAAINDRSQLLDKIAELERKIAEDRRMDAAQAENRQRQTSSVIASDTADHHRKWEIAANYQPIFERLGRETPRPRDDITASGYERHCLTGLQRYAKDPDLRAVDLFELADPIVERFGRVIRQDAMSPDAPSKTFPMGRSRNFAAGTRSLDGTRPNFCPRILQQPSSKKCRAPVGWFEGCWGPTTSVSPSLSKAPNTWAACLCAAASLADLPNTFFCWGK
jgi:hypothetical protein